MNNKIGIYFAYWTHEWEGDFIYYVNKVARLGFDTLEICPANLVDMPVSDRKAIKRAADDAGIDLTYCIGIPRQYDIASEDRDVRNAGVEYQKKLIDVVSSMDGQFMGGILYSCWPGAFSVGITDKTPYWNRSVDNMKKIAAYAEKNGVTLCMEVVNRFEQILLNQAYEAVQYCKDVDSPSCRILLDAFHMNIEEDDFIDAMKKYGRMYPNAGYGGRFRKWLFSNDREPYNSFGNGSAMRVSPCAWMMDCGFAARTGMWPSAGSERASLSAEVTHNHPEGIKGAMATASAIFLCRYYFGGYCMDYEMPINNDPAECKKRIKNFIENEYGYDLSKTLDEIRPSYSFNETCQGTVPQAIIAFLESTNFEDAIRNAISLGGDSDTLAAITGTIAEAAYGIPKWIKEKAISYLDEPLKAVVRRWEKGYPANWSKQDSN